MAETKNKPEFKFKNSLGHVITTRSKSAAQQMRQSGDFTETTKSDSK